MLLIVLSQDHVNAIAKLQDVVTVHQAGQEEVFAVTAIPVTNAQADLTTAAAIPAALATPETAALIRLADLEENSVVRGRHVHRAGVVVAVSTVGVMRQKSSAKMTMTVTVAEAEAEITGHLLNYRHTGRRIYTRR